MADPADMRSMAACHILPSRIGLFRAACLAVCIVLLQSGAAWAITAPTLVAPADDASSTAGASQTFSWTGALQGDGGALARSYFRLEMLDHTASSWSNATFVITDAGASTNQLTMAAPSAGSYRWRVCAYGVADETVSLVIEQLACSSSFSLTTTAASSNRVASDTTITVDRSVVVKGSNKRVVRERPSAVAATQPAATNTVIRRPAPVAFTASSESTTAARTAVTKALKSAAMDTGVTSDGDGVGAAISDGLNATLPGVPIPFWSLLLLGLAVPITRLWRRSLMGMFEWDDDDEVSEGSLDAEDERFVA